MNLEATEETGPDRLTDTQLAAASWDVETQGDEIRHGTCALLGWYGSGKSTTFGLRLLRHVAANPWTPRYERKTYPTTFVMAPTDRILRRATAPLLEETIPSRAILRRRGAPWSDWLLCNGHLIVAWSAETPMEAVTITGLFADEIQHESWWRNPRFWPNCVARVRDPRSSSLEICVAGLPESGAVRDTFGAAHEEPTPRARTFMFATADNPGLAGPVLEAIYSATAYEDRGLISRPGWRPPQNAVYRAFARDIHCDGKEGDPGAITHLAFDCGPSASAWCAFQEEAADHVNLVGQKLRAKRVRVVDAGEADHDDLDALCLHIRTQTNWQVGDRSTISVDPTLRRSEVQVLKRHFPRARVVQAERDDEAYYVEHGIANTARLLRDALGNVSLTFAPRADRAAKAIQEYKRLPSGRLQKNSAAEHLADCIRYGTSTLLPMAIRARGGEAQVWKR